MWGSPAADFWENLDFTVKSGHFPISGGLAWLPVMGTLPTMPITLSVSREYMTGQRVGGWEGANVSGAGSLWGAPPEPLWRYESPPIHRVKRAVGAEKYRVYSDGI